MCKRDLSHIHVFAHEGYWYGQAVYTDAAPVNLWVTLFFDTVVFHAEDEETQRDIEDCHDFWLCGIF